MNTHSERHGHGAYAHTQAPVGGISAVMDHIHDNPLVYVAGLVLFVLAIVTGIGIANYREAKAAQYGGRLAAAIEESDPKLRIEALESLTAGTSAITPDAVYLLGEAAYDVRDYTKATTAFTRIRTEYPEYPYVVDAVEGLGYIEENQEKYDAAIAIYQEILDKWTNTRVGLRQWLNLGRCKEAKEDLGGAIEAYQKQLEVDPQTPAAFEAQQRLDRLKVGHPDLFPEETLVVEETPELEAEATLDTPTITVETEPTPEPTPAAQ